MNSLRGFLLRILRYDWAIYQVVALAMSCLIAIGLVDAFGSEPLPAPGRPMTTVSAAFDIGMVYAVLVWLVIPGIAFVIVNVGAARKFRDALRGSRRSKRRDRVPIVRAKNGGGSRKVY